MRQALDDLPAPRLRDALALARFLRNHPIPCFVLGSASGDVALDLERCGLLALRREREDGITFLRVVGKPREVGR